VQSSAMNDVWNAAGAGDLAEVQRLIGEDPRLLNADFGVWGPTPLRSACRGGRLEVVRWLLDQGAVIGNALCYASAGGHLPMVRLLLERGADPTLTIDEPYSSDHESTPLIKACTGGHLETVRCLLDHPIAAATINNRSRWGPTALWWAAGFGYVSMVRALLEKGADPTIAESYTGTTPMARAHPACVEALEVRGPPRPYFCLHS
jgi:hypothetical protein